MQYPMMIPPFNFDSFETMTKTQAQKHFEWYISQIPERINILDRWFNDLMHCGLQFDYSLESLDLLWSAFEKHIKTEKKSERQIRSENKEVPEYIIEQLLEDRRDLTKETYAIALDIAIYFGEVLVRNLPGIHWGFFTKPKKMSSVNRPVLLGFRNNGYMEVERIVIVGCLESLEHQNSGFLSEVVNVWNEYLPS